MAANKRNYYHHSHTGLRVFCAILALLLIGGLTLGGIELFAPAGKKIKPSEWGKSDATVEESVKYETVLPANGGMTLPEKVEDGEEDDAGVKSNGISLMSLTIPVSQYAAYEISPAAETARTVTATVSPDNEAANTKIKWELSWKNAASEWATGKEVTDYVSLQTNADDLMESKTCTVSCAQAFGEQIILKAIAVDDETKFATCNVDYIRQVKSASVSIGDVSVNLGGNTDITIAIRRDYNGAGGKVTVTPIYGDVYTLENEFTATASLTRPHNDSAYYGLYYVKEVRPKENPENYYVTRLTYDMDEDIIGDSIYFDRRLFTQFNFFGEEEGGGTLGKYDKDELFSSLDQIEKLVSNFNTANPYYDGPFKGKAIWTMKVTLTSGSYEYTYKSDLVWAAIDETVPVGDVDITHDGAPGDIVFP